MIYQITDGFYTKIGYTKDVEGLNQRVSVLQTGNPNKLNLISVFDGGLKEEKLIHNSLSRRNKLNEWFNLDFIIDEEIFELLCYLGGLKKTCKLNKRERKDSISKKNKIKKLYKIIDEFWNDEVFISNSFLSQKSGIKIKTLVDYVDEDTRIKINKRNFEMFGDSDINKYEKNKNIDKIKNAINYYESKGIKPKVKNISEFCNIHRNTASRLIKEIAF